MIVYDKHGIQIECADILSVDIREKIDLVVTSPPYNVGIEYDAWNDSMSYDAYLDFLERAFSKCYEWCKDDGRLCVNVPIETSKDEKRHLYADIVHVLERCGWKYKTTILWVKIGNAYLNYGTWMSAKSPSVANSNEAIIVMYKKSWKKEREGESDMSKQEFIEYSNGMWKFSGDNKREEIGHPSVFPIELPKRCIKLFSYVGDLVLDPFMGSGTTLVACAMYRRRGIGVDISHRYCELAAKRVEKVINERIDKYIGVQIMDRDATLDEIRDAVRGSMKCDIDKNLNSEYP